MSFRWFDVLADRLSRPIVLLDNDGRVRRCNRAASGLLGIALDDRNLCDVVRDSSAARRILTLASRSSSPLPGAIVFKDNGRRWRCGASAVQVDGHSYVIMELKESNEAAERFLALNRKIDELQAEMRRRSELERQLDHLLELERDARAHAEDASRLKDEFLASVSHELRTPLHAIAGWVDLLQKNPGNQEIQSRGLEVIARNSRAQAQLTEDLVDVSLIVSGRMKLEMQPVDLEQVIRHAVESGRPAAMAKNIRLEVVATVGSCIVTGDPDRLLQVVWNLLTNATRHTPKGGKIQVRLERVNSHAEIIVSDTGEGIDPSLLPYVFDRFRRADGSSTRRHGGLGLGLAIVRHLVELHGGLVSVDSQGLGRGASFTINLPLPMFTRKKRTSVVLDGESPTEGTPMLEGIDVLLVEDHDDSRELLLSILEGEGARVRAVADAPSGRKSFEDNQPDVVLSDIEMPGEDGFMMMRKLRALEAERDLRPAVAIAVSAHSLGDARLRSLRSGYQAFLSKPLNSSELVETIRSLCKSKGR